LAGVRPMLTDMRYWKHGMGRDEAGYPGTNKGLRAKIGASGWCCENWKFAAFGMISSPETGT
jgi:hypothetical protein